MNSIDAIHDLLAGVAPIAQQTGAGARIEPNQRKEAFAYPSIVLESSVVPINTLSGWSGSDTVTVTINYWGNTYSEAHTLATLGRTALQDAGYILDSEIDNFEEDAGLAGKSCVTQVITYVS